MELRNAGEICRASPAFGSLPPSQFSVPRPATSSRYSLLTATYRQW